MKLLWGVAADCHLLISNVTSTPESEDHAKGQQGATQLAAKKAVHLYRNQCGKNSSVIQNFLKKKEGKVNTGDVFMCSADIFRSYLVKHDVHSVNLQPELGESRIQVHI